MGDSGIFRTGHQVWQRANIMAAANYLRERLGQAPEDFRVKSLYEGLLEVLDPSRRTVRVQRERHAAQVLAAVKVERRARERRAGMDRRKDTVAGAPDNVNRRASRERRSGKDRRKFG